MWLECGFRDGIILDRIEVPGEGMKAVLAMQCETYFILVREQVRREEGTRMSSVARPPKFACQHKSG